MAFLQKTQKPKTIMIVKANVFMEFQAEVKQQIDPQWDHSTLSLFYDADQCCSS